MSLGITASGSASGGVLDGMVRGTTGDTALRRAGSKLLAGVERSFERQGPGWKPLSARTIEERRRLGYGAGPILTRSGSFRRSFAATVEGETLTVGSDDFRAEVLLGGGGGVPARPVDIPQEDIDAAVKAVTDAVMGR